MSISDVEVGLEMSAVSSTSFYQSANNNNDYVNDDDRVVASEEENIQRLPPSVNWSKPASQDSSRHLLQLLENGDLSKIWEYIAKVDDRKTISSLLVCHIVVKCEEKQWKKRFCICCSCCPKSKCFENCEAQRIRMDNDSRRWLEILSNPLYIGVEWLWRNHYSSSISEKLNRDQQSQSQEMMECEDEDVIQAALHDAYILHKLTKDEYQYSRKEYEKLAIRCEQFAADLIGECDPEEDELGEAAASGAVDNELHEIMDIEGKGPLLSRSYNVEDHLAIWKPVHYEQSLSLLKYAADKGRKKFVSSPKCQSVLNEIIYYSPPWQDKGTLIKLLWFTIGHPILAVLSFWFYFFFHCAHPVRRKANRFKCGCCDRDGGDDDQREMRRGTSKLGLLNQLVEHPYSKFVSHTTSYIIFLVLLFISSFETDYGSLEMGVTAIDMAILAYVVGLCLEQTLKMCRQGAFIYLSKWWNVVDTFTIIGFVSSFLFWFSAYFHYGGWEPRKWYFVAADGLFASATVLAYFHLTHAFQVSSVLGPMQLSLYKMLRDVLKFLLIFLLLFIAFSNGVAKVYTYYVASQIHLRRKNDTQFDSAHPYSTHVDTFLDLFWLLFSTAEEHKISVPDPDFLFTEWCGRIFLVLYMICTVVVALSMLVAMMNNSFDRIMGPDHVDKEWKFSRARMWLEWIDEGNVLPPPLNILSILYILHPCVLWNFIRSCRETNACCEPRCQDQTRRILGTRFVCCKEKMRIRKNQNRMEIMKALVERYLKKRGKNIKEFERCLNQNQETNTQDETTQDRKLVAPAAYEESPGPSGDTDKTKQLQLQALSSIEQSLSSLKESMSSMDEQMADLRNVMAGLERKIKNMAANKGRFNKGFELE